MANKSLTAAKYLATMHLEYQNFLIIGKTLPVHHPQNKREPEQTFKLPQDIDTSVEVTKDDDSTPSKTTKKRKKQKEKENLNLHPNCHKRLMKQMKRQMMMTTVLLW